ncbi:MAG TPA: hypothetical protein PK990_00820 [Salinivirgaceae bacterium]|nr:hypothetical protein [Salinivirgaceae bacterium]
MKRYTLVTTLVLIIANTFGQSAYDALNFSTTFHSGSSRSLGMGGAFTALGSDPTSASLNPAGLGLYQSSDVQTTFAFDMGNTETNYLGNKTSEQHYNLLTQGFGFVFSIPNPQNYESGTGRISNVFAVNYNRVNSLDLDLVAKGTLSQIDQEWENYSRGNISHFDFSFAVNESNRLFYGLTFSLSSIDQTEDLTLTESDPQDVVPNVVRNIQNDYFDRRGLGFGIKTGILYAVTNQFRIGAAFHTPTIVSINEKYDYKTRTSYPNGIDSLTVEYYETDFNVLTPMRFALGISNVFANRVLLSLDYELSPYNTIRLDGNYYSYSDENREIKNNFVVRHGVRLGSELNLGGILLRAGGFYYSSPVKTSINDLSKLGLTVGAGIRIGNFYTDLAYSHVQNSGKYSIYNELAMRFSYDQTVSNVFATFGLRF